MSDERKFEIWVEGSEETAPHVFRIGAWVIGSAPGITFEDACASFFGVNEDYLPEQGTYKGMVLYHSGGTHKNWRYFKGKVHVERRDNDGAIISEWDYDPNRQEPTE